MAPARQQYSVNLDVLRAIAVLCVYVAHLHTTATEDIRWRSLGIFGVILFFVHTSCVLMASLARLDRDRPKAVSLALAFYVRRAFRIYPLSILTVALVAAMHIPPLPFDTYHWIGLKGLFANLALCQNLVGSPDILGVLWSLPLEVQMYMLLPVAYFIIRGRRFYSLVLWPLALAMAVIVMHSRYVSYLGVLAFAPCFTAGIVAFDLSRMFKSRPKLPAWLWPVGIAAGIVLFGPTSGVNAVDKLGRAWVISLLLGVLYSLVGEGRTNWMTRICHWIADHSYGIYLSHVILFWAAFNFWRHESPWLRFPLLAIASIGVPAILYVTVERPLIRRGADLAKRLIRDQKNPVGALV
jgi:peptidoglycan/LPS O-acetylase OafA/YrhL